MSANTNERDASVRTTGHAEYYSQLNGSICGNETLYCGDGGHNFVITDGPIQGQDPVAKSYIARGCGRGLVESVNDINAPTERTFTISAYRRCGGISELMYRPQCESVFYEVLGCNPPEDFDMITVYHGENPRDVTTTSGSLTDVNTKLTDSKTYLQVCSYVIAKIQFSDTIEFAVPVVDEVYFGEASCSASDGCGCSSASGHGFEKIAKLLDDGTGAPVLAISVDEGQTFTQTTLDGVDTGDYGVAIEAAASGLVVTTQNAGGSGGYVYVPYAGLGTCGSEDCNSDPVYLNGLFGEAPTDSAISGRYAYWSGMNGAIYQSSQVSGSEPVLVAQGVSTASFTRIATNGSTVVAVGADNGANSLPIVYSKNNGSTWQAATVPAGFPGYAITAVDVRSADVWEIGTDTGLILRTCDCGCTWTQINAASGPIDDIAYATDQVGYVATTNANGELEIMYTWNGGYDWLRGNCNTRGINLGACTRGAYPNLSGHHGYRIAIPKTGNLFTRANHMLIGGGTADGTGCQHIGTPNYIEGK